MVAIQYKHAVGRQGVPRSGGDSIYARCWKAKGCQDALVFRYMHTV